MKYKDIKLYIHMEMDSPDFLIVSRQRSGTHLLESALASHPKIHGRGEIMLSYFAKMMSDIKTNPFILKNKPKHINVAIIMYNKIEPFQTKFGSIFSYPLIHLIRNREDVIKSLAQLNANKEFDKNLKAHYNRNQEIPKFAPVTERFLRNAVNAVNATEKTLKQIENEKCNKITITYEEMTQNKDITELPEPVCRKLLSFLNLDYIPLTVKFQKTLPFLDLSDSLKNL